MLRRFTVAGLGLFTALATSRAHASPGDGYSMSDDAALMGGAVVATGRDVASSWYNPALLANNRRTRADVSTAAYGIRWLRVPASIRTRAANQQRRTAATSREFLVVPTAFAIGTRVRPRLSVGFGFFTSTFAEPSLVVRESFTPGGYRQTTEIRRSAIRRRYHTGPLLGWRITPGLDIGVAVLGVYDKESSSQRVFIDNAHRADARRATLLSDGDSSVKSYGAEAVFGLRGRLGKWVRGGASLRTPTAVLVQRVEGSNGSIDTETDAQGQTQVFTDLDTFPVQRRPVRIANWQVAVGLGVGNTRWQLGLDAEASPPLTPRVPTIARRAVWNVRAGGRLRLGRRWTIGGGLFTDRNSNANGSFGNAQVDLWGGSLGIQLRTPVRLHRRERARQIAFRTTFAIRYAGGRGKVGGLQVDYGSARARPTDIDLGVATDATMHLLTLHAGSGLVF